MPPPPGYEHLCSPTEFRSRKRRLRSSDAALSFASPAPRVPETPDIADRPRKPSGQVDHDEPDPDYVYFMQHLRLQGRFYIFDTEEEGWSPVRYEACDDSDIGDRRRQSKKRKSSYMQKTNTCKANKRNRRKTASSGKDGKAQNWGSCEKADVRSSMIDEDYQVFLSHLREHNGSAAIHYGNVTVFYEVEKAESEAREDGEYKREEVEKIVEDDSDEVIIVEPDEIRKENNTCSSEMESQSHCSSSQPSVSLELDVRDPVKAMMTRGRSPFSSGLMSAIDKPFDQEELNGLLALASERKFIVKYTHLRKESIPYVTDQLGFSYLDHFPDFARELESADDHKVLTLLRGFFFWLQNKCHPGAYVPWKAIPTDYVTV